MIKSLFLAFIFLSSINLAFCEKQATIWGKILKVEKGKNLKDKYFIYYQKDGKDFAYPINVNLLKKNDLKKYTGKLVRITGQVKKKKIKTDGPEVETLVFLAKTITQFKLKDLQVKNPLEPIPNNLRPKNEFRGGLTISDSFANMAILTGGAAILGTIIKDQFTD